MTEMEERFRRDLAEVTWRDLRIHMRRDALILVAASLDLIEVATAVARDDKETVQGWVAMGALGKPVREQLDSWETDLEQRFRMLIVQPFILIQECVDA